ncbi:MAG: cobalamin-dependent protein [Prevotella sp.]|nr:cobalamin-dependent protein [Prevotella sp.]MDY5258989.1 cobalamin-dependent protein [Prevotella sp.]
MEEILQKIQNCVEMGKINAASPFPPAMKGQPGAAELTQEALKQGLKPGTIMNDAMIPAMGIVGERFSQGKVFVPQMLMAAKAMNAGLEYIKPYFTSGDVKMKGTFIIGTVFGDMHDIGKNLVAMMVEGSGYKVVDLGIDCPVDRYEKALDENPGAIIGLSALLTTTMTNMKTIIDEIHKKHPDTKFIVGGAPVTPEFAQQIGSAYGKDPQDVVEKLDMMVDA